MSQQLLPLQANNLPAGFCPASNQDLLNAFAAAMFAVLNTGGGSGAPVASGFVISASKPADQTVAWLQQDTLGRPTRLYLFAQGAWLSLHPTVPGLTMWWFSALPNFAIFDGGDSNALSSVSGPMWQQAVNSDGVMIAAKFPVAAGTLPSSTVLNQGAYGGEEVHVLLGPEIAPHLHTLDNCGLNAEAPGQSINNANGHLAGSRGFATSVPGTNINTLNSVGGGAGGIAVGHNTLPVFVVGYLLQRTARLFYRVT